MSAPHTVENLSHPSGLAQTCARCGVRRRPAVAARLTPRLFALCLLAPCLFALTLPVGLASAAPGSVAPDSQRAKAGPKPEESVPFLVCVPPKRGGLDSCPKGAKSANDPAANRGPCRSKRQPRVRLDRGPWVTLSPTRWRCLPWRGGERLTIAIENNGRRYASWRASTRGCEARRLDVVFQEFYGTAWSRCSRRKHTAGDEVLPVQ